MLFKYKILFLFVITIQSFFSQIIGPNAWIDWSSFNSPNSVTKFNGNVLFSNANAIGILNPLDSSITKLSKANGLGDVGISLIRTNKTINKLFVAYSNSNIDIVNPDLTVSNFPDFKNKSFNGSKVINEIAFKGNFAYLACGFGIVLFDMQKIEVKDVYYIGPNGTNVNVYNVAFSDSLIYAATSIGLLKCNLLSNASNYNNWTKINFPNNSVNAPVSGVCVAANKVYAIYSPYTANNAIIGADTIYEYKPLLGAWSKFNENYPNYFKKMLYCNGAYFSYIDQFGLKIINAATDAVTDYFTLYNGTNISINDTYFEYQQTFSYFNNIWYADNVHGCVYSMGSSNFITSKSISFGGAKSNYISKLDAFNGKIAIAPSAPHQDGTAIFLHQGIQVKKGNYFNQLTDAGLDGNDVLDFDNVYFDRNDTTKMYASSWYEGFHVYKNNTLVATYNGTNSPMQEITTGSARVSGIGQDNKGNVWFASSDVGSYLNVLQPNGNIISFQFKNPAFVRRIIVDRNNYVWILHERGNLPYGVTVYDGNSMTTPVEGVNVRYLSAGQGSGNLGSNAAYSICEDKDGKIWVGTDNGVAVFYSPNTMFSASNYDAQPIKIVQDNIVELLLSKSTVSSIVIDGANNKWVGTSGGGVYCFSPDGQQQINRFTINNCPLYSNNIIDMAYDQTTGDVYFGTDVGLQSFRSPIIEGLNNYDSIAAFPNPVRPSYTGSVYVKGLIDATIIKIVDQGGNLVWETKSSGGQIVWPVTSLNGSRVKTGVYIVYAATTDGQQKALTKILVVN
ncbi:MAG: hypothetical protein JSU07_05915 [Bacteroidetes bacterium]|nr:hypothetical protein [Bacteroidota bacterium]